MTEESIVIQKQQGYYWSISIEFTDKVFQEGTTTHPNQIVTKYTLSGNEETPLESSLKLVTARNTINNIHKEVKQ